MVAVPLAAIGLAGYGVVGVLRYWLIRHGDYRAVSQVTIAQSIVRAASQVGFGLLGAGVFGLLVSDVLGRVLGLGTVVRGAWGTLAAARATATVGTGAVAREFWRFPVFGAPSSLLNAAAAALPVPLLAGVYGLPIAGQFALVQRVLGLPLSVIGTSVGDAMLGRMSEQARSDPAAALPLFRRLAFGLAGIGVPGALVLALIGPELFAVVFGEPWRDAGTVAALMAPWLVAAMIVSPLSRVALVYQAQGQKLIYDLLSLAAVAGSILGGAAAGFDAFESIRLLAWLQTAAYSVYLVVLYRLVVAGSARLPRV
jgi:O-antigen/teichoic acid export membrane protein